MLILSVYLPTCLSGNATNGTFLYYVSFGIFKYVTFMVKIMFHLWHYLAGRQENRQNHHFEKPLLRTHCCGAQITLNGNFYNSLLCCQYQKIVTNKIAVYSPGCYEQTEKLLGKVTMVVNNAGILNEIDWKKMVDINLVRYYLEGLQTIKLGQCNVILGLWYFKTFTLDHGNRFVLLFYYTEFSDRHDVHCCW